MKAGEDVIIFKNVSEINIHNQEGICVYTVVGWYV